MAAADINEIPEQRKNLSQTTQILLALREARESMTKDGLAEATGIRAESVKARLNELKKAGRVIDIVTKGTQSAKRWALASYRTEVDA